MESGKLTSISSRQCSAISGRPLPEKMDFGRSLQLDRPTYAAMTSQPHYGLQPAMFSDSILVLIATHLRTPEGRKVELV